MDKQMIITGVLVDEDSTVSFVEICEHYDMTEDMLLDMIEHGLVQQASATPKMIQIHKDTLRRIQSARRLQSDLGVNVPGAVLALELLDQLEQIRQELEILKRHVHE